MIKFNVFLLTLMLISNNTKAQIIPGYIQNLPLKPNQKIAPWGYGINRVDIDTYLDDGVLNERTIDSLASDSKQLMDSIITKLGPDCDYFGFRYHNRLVNDEESSIRIAYWLRNGIIVRIDSFRSEHLNNAHIRFPLLSNQYLYWDDLKIPRENFLKNELIFYNIIPGRRIMYDSLEMDNKRILVKLLKTSLKQLITQNTGRNFTAIRIRYVNQAGSDIIKEYFYSLKDPFSPQSYLRMYENEK